MRAHYRKTFGRVVALLYTAGTVMQVLQLIVRFDWQDMPFFADVAIVGAGAYGGLGLVVFAREIAYRGTWERVVHGLMILHLLASVALHVWILAAGSHAVLAIFPYGYSFFAAAYFGLFAWRAWTMRLRVHP